MKKSLQHERIEQEWERALEQAKENTARPETLDSQALNDAAGLRIRTGVQAGLWGLGQTVTCEYSCGC